jgi:hypothetical protein
MRVLAQAGMLGLVEQRQSQLRQIDEDDLEAAVGGRPLGEPLGDREPDATGACARKDDQQLRLQGDAPMGLGTPLGVKSRR